MVVLMTGQILDNYFTTK